MKRAILIALTLVGSVICEALADDRASCAACIYVSDSGTNPIYRTSLTGQTNLVGAVHFCQRVVQAVSTNMCLHIITGQAVKLSDVMPILEECSALHLRRVVVYWKKGGPEATDYAYQRIVVIGDVADPRHQPLVEDDKRSADF